MLLLKLTHEQFQSILTILFPGHESLFYTTISTDMLILYVNFKLSMYYRDMVNFSEHPAHCYDFKKYQRNLTHELRHKKHYQVLNVLFFF